MNNLPDKEVIKKIILKSDEKILSVKVNYDNNLYDDAVSRMYYAVFHLISAVLLTKNMTFSTHGQTLGFFNKEFIRNGIFPDYFSKYIELLFKSRQVGDYDPDIIIDQITAEERISQGNEIIAKLKEYLSSLYRDEFGI